MSWCVQSNSKTAIEISGIPYFHMGIPIMGPRPKTWHPLFVKIRYFIDKTNFASFAFCKTSNTTCYLPDDSIFLWTSTCSTFDASKFSYKGPLHTYQKCFLIGIANGVFCKESFINPVVKFLGIFDPLPPSWSLLLNKTYVIKWSFG